MSYKNVFNFILIACLVFQPLLVVAQTTPSVVVCPDGSVIAAGATCPNTGATNANLQRFNPAARVDTGNNSSFNGLSFSGVGGAVLGCTNIGSSIVSNVSNLFKNSEKQAKNDLAESFYSLYGVNPGTTEEQPVTDKKALDQLNAQTQRENCLNGIAYAVAKNTLQQVTNKTLNWVNTGFNGNPLYVRDVNSYLQSIRDQKLSDFLGNVGNSDPVFGNALRSAITQEVTGYTDGRLNVAMNTPEGKAYSNFQNDFTQGGWGALLNQNNNPVGAFFKATDKLSTSINSAQQNTKDELAQGNGFLSMKKCVEYEPVSATSAINPNGGYANLCASNPDLPYCKDNAPAVVLGQQQQKCLRYETVTPGSVIQAQTVAVTTSAVRQLEQADKINEVLGSFFDGLLNRLFASGIGALTGSNARSTINYGNVGNNVVIGSNGLPISNVAVSAEDSFGYQRANGGFFGEFDISRPQQLRAVLKSQLDFLNRSIDTQVAMSTIVPTLGELDYCLPGPNPSWTVGTNYNFQLFDSALQGKQPTHTLGNTVSALSSAAATIPGPGTIIAIVGNVVGGILNTLNDDGGPKTIETKNLQLFDKVTNGARQISDYSLHRKSNVELLPFIERSYNSTVDSYKNLFSPETITNAFVAADSGNAAYAKGQATEILRETGNLVYYNQAIAQYSKEQIDNISQTQDAIATLDTINDEVEGIVATAKARYIKERAAAGTPVDVACINQAYNVSTADITGVTRLTTDTVDPIVLQSTEAANYFYSHL